MKPPGRLAASRDVAEPLPAPSRNPSLHAVERLPALGGAELVRARGLGPAAPLLVAGERRIEPLPEAPLGRVPGEWSASYVVPAESAGGAAALEWPDGPQVVLPAAGSRRVPRLVLAAPPWEPHRAALERELARAAAVAAAAREETAARIAEQGADMRLVRDQAAGRVARAEQLASAAGARAREAAEAAALAEARLEAEVIARGALGSELDRVAAEAVRTAQAVRRARAADADALAAVAAELDAERSAHAVTRGTVARLREELAAARRAAAPAPAAAAGSPAPVDGSAEPATAGASLGRANGARGEGDAAPLPAAASPGAVAAPASPPAAADLRRLGLAQAAAAAAAPSPGSGRLVADLDAAAAALRRATEPLLTRRLRDVLVSLAREDPVAAGELLVQLVPAQAAVIGGRLSYDLTVRGVGTYAVTMDGGAVRAVRLPRPRRHADFALSADPLALAQWLAGAEVRIGRLRGPIRRRGSRRALGPLRTLPQSTLSLADAARAGARLEPRLVYRALTYAVQPEWTRGHRFVVAQALPDATFYLAANDGAGLTLLEAAEPDATVTLTREGFDCLLRDEPPAPSDRPSVRGDRAAVATLREWVDRARGSRS